MAGRVSIEIALAGISEDSVRDLLDAVVSEDSALEGRVEPSGRESRRLGPESLVLDLIIHIAIDLAIHPAETVERVERLIQRLSEFGSVHISEEDAKLLASVRETPSYRMNRTP